MDLFAARAASEREKALKVTRMHVKETTEKLREKMEKVERLQIHKQVDHRVKANMLNYLTCLFPVSRLWANCSMTFYCVVCVFLLFWVLLANLRVRLLSTILVLYKRAVRARNKQ